MMRQPWEVITLLESDNSRLAKEAIIEREAILKNTVFFEGCRLALDKLITFGLKKIEEKTNEDGLGLDWDSFNLILTGFVNREFTGNLARDTVSRMMDTATKEQWNNWYRRILIKDLRCGVSEKTINKAVKDHNQNYSVPVFSCQLAHDSANHTSKLTGKRLIETKLDGVRILAVVYPSGVVNLFSRNGKELINFEHIQQQLAKTAVSITDPVVYDGEVMSSSFQDLMKQVYRKEDVNASDAILYIFDSVPLADFEKGVWNKRQEDRSAIVLAWYDQWKDLLPNVSVLEHETVDLDTAEGQQLYKEINKRAIDGGYEGIMIKDPNAPYECKRSTAWLKLKPFIEVSLEVIDVEEGTGRNLGRLGALVCSGVDDNKHISVNVGSGFSDNQRDDFWINRAGLCGTIVEVRADAITQNQDGSYSLRFPRFKSFRGFKHGEKL